MKKHDVDLYFSKVQASCGQLCLDKIKCLSKDYINCLYVLGISFKPSCCFSACYLRRTFGYGCGRTFILDLVERQAVTFHEC